MPLKWRPASAGRKREAMWKQREQEADGREFLGRRKSSRGECAERGRGGAKSTWEVLGVQSMTKPENMMIFTIDTIERFQKYCSRF